MAVLNVETKNRVQIGQKPRVYFTCHPEDHARYFRKICDDLFKTHDCAVYYTADMTQTITEAERESDLVRSNLLVVPVTLQLLTEPNRAMDEDVPYALAKHIPVLPIMMEEGLDDLYSKPDKFGELQYLNPMSADMTEISYEEKLKKYLDTVLISEEMAKRIRAAFDAYIFLSYRKKDRKHANELMRLIHTIPGCRDIAVWFDEFLVPGESFRENIEKIMADAGLFALLVTPQLLEKTVDANGETRDNYVISTELPLAQRYKAEKGTDILAVEMEDTDKEALRALNLESYVNYKDRAFHTTLLQAVARIAVAPSDSLEHNYLIGLAYLEGIDVEVDHDRALELIVSASEAGVTEATAKLVDMYQNGIGVAVDPLKAAQYQDICVAQLREVYAQNSCQDTFFQWFDAAVICGRMYSDIGMDDEARKRHMQLAAIINRAHQNVDADYVEYAQYLFHAAMAESFDKTGVQEVAIDNYLKCISLLLKLELKGTMTGLKGELCTTYLRMALAYEKLQQFEEAEEAYNNAEDFAQDSEDLAELSGGLASLHIKRGDCDKALKHFDRCKTLYRQLWEETQDDRHRKNQAIACTRMGQVLETAGQLDQALNCYFEAIELQKELAERTQSYDAKLSLANTYTDAAIVFSMLKMYREALDFGNEALKIREALALRSRTVPLKKGLADSYHNVGSMLVSTGQVEAGLQMLCKAVEVREDLADTTQDWTYKLDLCATYDNLGNLYRLLKQGEEALRYFERSLKVVDNMSSPEENNDLLYQRAFSQLNIGILRQDAVTLEKACAGFDYLARKCPDVVDYARRRDVAKQKLEALRPSAPPPQEKTSFFDRMRNKFKK